MFTRALTQKTTTRTNPAGAEIWIRQGWSMAKREDEGVFQSIELNHVAETAEHGVHEEHLKARGRAAFQSLRQIEESLRDLHFDPAAHLKQLAHGKVDLIYAVTLLSLNAVLAVLVLLAFGPTWVSLPLAFLVVVSAVPVEEFFQAHADGVALREGIFLTAAILALAAQFWLGTVRGLLLEAVSVVDVGPVTHAIHTAAPIFRWTFGILATVSECLCGYKLFQARTALLSATARAVRERDSLNHKLTDLHTSLETARVEADVSRAYRQIGARQYLAWKAGAERRDKANHLRRALAGALIALLIIIALLFFLASNSFGAIPAGRSVIALIDLSKSVSDEKFRANVEAVSSLFPKLHQGDRFIVIGITDSFGNTQIILDRTMPGASGYMGLEAQSARETLSADWRRISGDLPATHKFVHTDIVGSLIWLSYVTGITHSNMFIFIFSDLRQSTPELDLEPVSQINVANTLLRAKRAGKIPALKRAKVFLLGVDPTGKSTTYIAGLKDFWIHYFSEAGAEVNAFSLDRSIPEF